MGKYRTIVADPPWEMSMRGRFRDLRPGRTLGTGNQQRLPYPTLSIGEICALDVEVLAASACHIWLWTTSSHLEPAFGVLRSWGFSYLAAITWVKPSGAGAYFATTTQHCLFGYYKRCEFPLRRWAPTHFFASARQHSEKPGAFLDLVESVSPEPRIELFARRQRLGWDTWGNEALEHVTLDNEVETEVR